MNLEDAPCTRQRQKQAIMKTAWPAAGGSCSWSEKGSRESEKLPEVRTEFIRVCSIVHESEF